MKNLNEEINRFRLMSNYNPKLTLTENTEIDEVRASIGTSARELETLVKSVDTLRAELKIGMNAAKMERFLAMDAKSFAKEMENTIAKELRDGAKVGTLGPKAKELSKIDVLRRMAEKSRNKGGKKLTAKEIESIIETTALENKLLTTKIKPKKPKIDLDPAVEREAQEVIEKTPDIKNWDWKTIKKWGIRTGVAIAVLYAIYKLTHGGETPPEPNPIPPNPNPIPPNPNPSPGPGPSKYHDCSDFPYTKWCSGGVIPEVQKCLKITSDGKFGPGTEKALISAGYGSEITKEVYDKIKEKCSSSNSSGTNADTGKIDPRTDQNTETSYNEL